MAKIIRAQEAAAQIPDGASVAVVGMGLAGGVLLIRSKKQSAARRTDNDFDLDEDDETGNTEQP